MNTLFPPTVNTPTLLSFKIYDILIIDKLENQNSGKNDLTHVSIIPKATTPYVFMHYIIFSCTVFT